MRNFVQPGDMITVAAPLGGVTSGDLVVIGSLIGVAAVTAAAGAEIALATTGVYELPKAVADDVAVGELLYFDAAGSNLTNVAGQGGKPLAGVAVSAAAAGALTVRCKLGVHGLTGPA